MKIDEFMDKWYSGEDIEIDSIEDPVLRSMVTQYYAQEEDLADLYEKIGDYIHAQDGRRYLYAEGDASADGQSNGTESRLSN